MHDLTIFICTRIFVSFRFFFFSFSTSFFYYFFVALLASRFKHKLHLNKIRQKSSEPSTEVEVGSNETARPGTSFWPLDEKLRV